MIQQPGPSGTRRSAIWLKALPAAAVLLALTVTAAVEPAPAGASKERASAEQASGPDADGDERRADDERRQPSGRRIGRPIRVSELDDALELLERLKPELADRLTSLRDDEPERAARVLHQRFPRLRYLLWLKESDPSMYELRVRDLELSYLSRDLAARYAELRGQRDDDDADGPGERAAAMRDELSLLLAEQFEVRQQIRQRELEQLEQRMAALRAQIEARHRERDEVIERRLEELTEE